MSKKMRVTVDLGLCQGHSVCKEEAPDVFDVIDRDEHYPQVKLLTRYPPPELWEQVREAEMYCPNGVIRTEMVDEDDDRIEANTAQE